MEPDAVILVCDASIWNRIHACEAVKEVMKSEIPYAVIYNHSVIGIKNFIPKGAVLSAFFCAPFFPDPFTVCNDTEAFYQAVTNAILAGEKGRSNQKFPIMGWIKKVIKTRRKGENHPFGKDTTL